MVTVRSLILVLLVIFAGSSRVLAQPDTQPPLTLQQERPPSLLPPLLVTAAGGAMLIATGALALMSTSCFSCIDLLGEGYTIEDDGREPNRRLRIVAGVGGGLLVIGLGWLLARQHARMKWRSRPRQLAPTVSLDFEPRATRYELGLRGTF